MSLPLSGTIFSNSMFNSLPEKKRVYIVGNEGRVAIAYLSHFSFHTSL
jgi:hypothetical protein